MKHRIHTIRRYTWQFISIIFAFGFIIMLFQYVRVRGKMNGPNSQEVLRNLSRIMVLPSGTPHIQPISDTALYKTAWPDLYHDVEPGEILIQYPHSSLIYDPAQGKIINIAVDGIFDRPKPAQVLTMAFRYNGNERYRALFLKRQVEEDMGDSSYQITEVSPSKVAYKDDVIYVLNPKKQDLITQFAKAIGNSPVIDTPDPKEAPTTADSIVAFKSMQ